MQRLFYQPTCRFQDIGSRRTDAEGGTATRIDESRFLLLSREAISFFIFVSSLFVLLNLSISANANITDTVIGEGNLDIVAENRPLGEVLDMIYEQSGVRIKGLNGRRNDAVNITAENQPVEQVVKRLLRYLDENNYAFFYNRTALSQVSVYPSAGGSALLPPELSEAIENADPDEKVSVVRILRVTPDSQAEANNLQKNDIVVEYDGQKIENARQLVEAVKAKSPAEVVEMTVIRDSEPFRVVLNGGMIGINIITASVPRSELGAD